MPHRVSYPDGAVPPVYLFGAAGASGEERLDLEPRGIGDIFSRNVCGADMVTSQYAAIGNAELCHQLFFVVVGDDRDIHKVLPSASPASGAVDVLS